MSVPAITLRALPIRLQIALLFGVFLVAVILSVGMVVLTALDNTLERQTEEALRLRASRVEREIAVGENDRLDPEDVEAGLLELAPLDEFSAPGIYVQVRDERGEVIAASPNLPRGELPVTPEMIATALGGESAFLTVPAGTERLRLLAEPVDIGDRVAGIIVVGQSQRPLEATRQEMQELILLVGVAAVVVAVVGGWWLTARVLGPVAEVTRVARQIAATGRFERRIAPRRSKDELGDLTATFNDMLERLERTFRRQREFVADASHELRGPLMVIRGNLDLLRLGLPDEAQRQSIREATEEVERMSRLASDLLFLARSDVQDVLEQENVALDAVVAEAWERARALDGVSHELQLARLDAVTVRGDRVRLGQVVWNLLENALRYTPAGGRVTVSLACDQGTATLTVADTGAGIAADHLPRIFERFYRVDRSRSRREGGAGLGLAIVKHVAEAHAGSVVVQSHPGRGSTFSVTLPVEASQLVQSGTEQAAGYSTSKLAD